MGEYGRIWENFRQTVQYSTFCACGGVQHKSALSNRNPSERRARLITCSRNPCSLRLQRTERITKRDSTQTATHLWQKNADTLVRTFIGRMNVPRGPVAYVYRARAYVNHLSTILDIHVLPCVHIPRTSCSQLCTLTGE